MKHLISILGKHQNTLIGMALGAMIILINIMTVGQHFALSKSIVGTSNKKITKNYDLITSTVTPPVLVDSINPITLRLREELINDPNFKSMERGRSPLVYGDFDPSYPGVEMVVPSRFTVHTVFDGFWRDMEIYVFHADGTLMDNWAPKILSHEDYPYEYFLEHPLVALADLDQDNELEMVVNLLHSVFAFNNDGSAISGLWPKYNITIRPLASHPVIADLDNDGFAEIIEGDGAGLLHIWRYDGQVYSSSTTTNPWPMVLGEFAQYGHFANEAPAIGNLDSDPEPEIVFAGQGTNLLYALNEDGSALNNNWPVAIASDYGAFTPTLGDVDQDGELEIIVGSRFRIFGNEDHPVKVYVFNTDGSLVNGWPKDIENVGYLRQVVIADLDLSFPGLELIASPGTYVSGMSIGTAKTIYAWHYDGTNVSGWPYVVADENHFLADWSSPVVADFDNDADLEVVVPMDYTVGGSYGWKLYFIKSDGTDFINSVVFNSKYSRLPTIGDLDDDGVIDIMLTEQVPWPRTPQYYTSKIMVKKFVGAGSSILTGGQIAWPMWGANARRAGEYFAD